MGDFCEKSHFSPLKSWKYLNIAKKSEKKALGWSRPGGEGVSPRWKNFFAFLDELDHLEAKKKILIVGGKWIPVNGNFPPKDIFSYLSLPLANAESGKKSNDPRVFNKKRKQKSFLNISKNVWYIDKGKLCVVYFC